MLITCPSCQAKFRIADEKVSGRDASVRCRSCQATFHIGSFGAGSAPPSRSPGARAASSAPPPKNDESSQMFTLAALVGRAHTQPPPAMAKQGTIPPPAPVARREGSGVIDLNALARAAEERARRAQSEPPPSTFTREARPIDEPPPATSRKLRFVGIAAAAGMLAIVGLIVAVSGGDEPKPQARAAAVQVEAPKPAAPVAPPPVVASTPAQDTTPASSPMAQTPKSRGAKWSAAPRRGAGGKHASGPKVNMTQVTSGGFSAKSSPAPAAKAKPSPGADPCGCKGNLQCAIKCFK